MTGEKARDFWFKFEPARWRSDEGLRLCSLAARGLWIELLSLMHPKGGYLLVAGKPPDETTLARLVGSTQKEIQELLKELADAGVSSIDVRGALFSRHMVREIERVQTLRRNGQKGGNPSLLDKRLVNQGCNQAANQAATELEVRDQSKRSELDQERTRLAPQASDDGFARFWERYPRKVAKPAAARAWRKLCPSAPLSEIVLSAIEAHKRQPQWQRDDGAYIPHPATWLNQRRWEDTLAVSGASGVETAPDAPDQAEDWWSECRRLHDLTCGHRRAHEIVMLRRMPLETSADDQMEGVV